MARSFNFAILRLAPDNMKLEAINIGLAVFGSSGVKFYFSKGLEKARVISKAINPSEIIEITSSLSSIYTDLLSRKDLSFEQRLKAIAQAGPIKLAFDGEFIANSSHSFEMRISSLLKMYVDPEPAQHSLKEKRSRVLTDIKRAFRSEKVLAKPHEDLSSHRIVPSVQIDDGLVADLVLRNSAFHVTETVDAASDHIGLRKVIADLGVSTLVLERARMNFKDAIVKTNLVYTASTTIERSLKPALDATAHLNINLINWASESDRRQYVSGLVSLAIPHEERSRHAKPRPVISGRLSFH